MAELIAQGAMESAVDFLRSRDKKCQEDHKCVDCPAFVKCYRNYMRQHVEFHGCKDIEEVRQALLGAAFKRLV